MAPIQDLLQQTLAVSREEGILSEGLRDGLRGFATGALLGASAVAGAHALADRPMPQATRAEQTQTIEDTPKKETPQGVQIDLDRIAQIESSNNPKAVNPRSKARGLFQFMRPTWDDISKKTKKNWPWEDAFDGKKSRYLANYYFHTEIPRILKSKGVPDSVETRLAAYNWGAGNVSKAYKLHKADWLAYAPEETKNYIQKYKK